MQRPPLIGISTYPPQDGGPYTLPVDYVQAVRRAGGLALLLPPGEADAHSLVVRLDALILPGGGDVDPRLYGGQPHERIYGVDPVRDHSEAQLVRAALARRLPLLCICRGLQLLNVALGGSLIEHIPEDGAVQHRGGGPGSRNLHPVQIEAGSTLARILSVERCTPSSSHHQAIRALAPGLRVSARASDGTLEGVECPTQPFLVGVQWHPEHTAAADPVQQRLFDALVAAARGG